MRLATCIVILALMGCSWDRSPDRLKKRDAAIEACAKDCSPRKQDWSYINGCYCEDK